MVFQQSVFKMVAKSPFRKLQKHMAAVYEAAELLPNLIQLVFSEDWKKTERVFKQITALESKADNIKISLSASLQKNLFLPISKENIILILLHQDKIANLAEDIAGVIYGRRMVFPETLHAIVFEYVKSAVLACYKANTAIKELSQVLESNFSKSVKELTSSIIAELNQIESNNDHLQIDIRKQLYILESELNPVDIIFIYKTIEQIGMLADCAQNVGFQLLTTVLKK